MESYLSLPLDNHLTGFEKVERQWCRFPSDTFTNMMVAVYAFTFGLPFHDEDPLGTVVYCSIDEEVTMWQDLQGFKESLS